MAYPRVFVSSTYYDLRFVRADLSVLEEEMGIEIVRFETGDIPYHTAPTLSEACCKEIDNCHILLSIIGGRYGSTVLTKFSAPDRPIKGEESFSNIDEEASRIISISRMEVERAIRSGLLLFTFVDSSVMTECRTYNINIQIENAIKWAAVDSPKVFEFINYVQSLEGRNPIFEFRTPKEIKDFMRQQLAGIFCDLLVREKLSKYSSHLDQVIESAERLESLQARLRVRESEAEAKLKEMLLPDHPLFSTCRDLLGSNIRVFFKTRSELNEFLKLFGYEEVDPRVIHDEKANRMAFFCNRDANSSKKYIGFAKNIFDTTGNLQLPDAAQWNDSSVWYGKKI